MLGTVGEGGSCTRRGANPLSGPGHIGGTSLRDLLGTIENCRDLSTQVRTRIRTFALVRNRPAQDPAYRPTGPPHLKVIGIPGQRQSTGATLPDMPYIARLQYHGVKYYGPFNTDDEATK